MQNKAKGRGKPEKICYKCGGNDHSVWDCKSEAAEGGEAAGKFAFAACFVCGEKGHISRECPQNAKGIYVNGGHCKYVPLWSYFACIPELVPEWFSLVGTAVSSRSCNPGWIPGRVAILFRRHPATPYCESYVIV